MPDAEYDLAIQISKLPKLADRRVDLCKKLFVEMQQPEHKLHHLLPNVKTNAHGLLSSAKYQVLKV